MAGSYPHWEFHVRRYMSVSWQPGRGGPEVPQPDPGAGLAVGTGGLRPGPERVAVWGPRVQAGGAAAFGAAGYGGCTRLADSRTGDSLGFERVFDYGLATSPYMPGN